MRWFPHISINVHLKMEELMQMLHNQKFINFTQLFSQTSSRKEIVATLLALLELVKVGSVLVQQVELFGEIRGYPAQLSLEVA